VNEYENVRRIAYGDEGATFVPVCKTCGRFVKADAKILVSHALGPIAPNATCKKCGRTEMLFEGYY
jgi:hypothetical protein